MLSHKVDGQGHDAFHARELQHQAPHEVPHAQRETNEEEHDVQCVVALGDVKFAVQIKE